ncbi:cadherin-like domain-containing protein [Devosia rhizoryzae]|uniref:Cadherin-like domain-containing protein n=1 Tax=Devosia rhizoryzae TaxID=2774137 RepID=A0ABX7C693_9HYPH|nr:cadherin-like domain-containing protein [Devosia rhizoryzae]QQR39257.1 cadherin-like domain-containing protein [Devosia rhizoryzae]
MIIQAKSSRQQEPTQLDGRKRYEFMTPERLSRLPLYVAGIVVLVAAYLKSAVENKVLALAPTPAPDEAPEALQRPVNWCLPGDELLSASLEEPGVDPTITGSTGDGAGPRSQVGIGPAWPGPFIPLPAPTISFTKPFEPFNASIQAFFPAAFELSFSNDNPGAFPAGGTSVRPQVDRPDEDGHTSPSRSDYPDEDGDVEEEEEEETDVGNRPPMVSAPVRLNDVFAGQVVLIGLSSLLFGAHDPDGDPLTILNMTASGVGVVRSTNGWTVSTEHGSLGEVELTYQISDGEAAVWQTAVFNIIRNGETLTPGDDLHAGTPYDDDIDGLGGDDIIDALAGNDMVSGGDGDDHINGGDGDDHLFGGNGNDVIFGGRGDDVILGGNGNDRLLGGDGDDMIDGQAGDDFLYGEAGDDLLTGGDGCDLLDGGTGNDLLLGEAGDDRLEGGTGNDALFGGAGNDILIAGSGNDVLDGGEGCDLLEGGDGDDQLTGGASDDRVKAGAGNDRILGDAGDDQIDGGAGDDILDYAAAGQSVIFDLSAGRTYSCEFGTDTFSGIEQAIGGDGDDIFILGATATVTMGGRGRDTFIFEVAGDDPTISEDVMHDILDFVVGDRIRVLDYEIDRSAREAEKDLFRSVYQDDDDDAWLRSDLPIIVRHERTDGVDQTVIMADVDRDDVYEITINVHGIHLPINPEAGIA